MEGLNILNHGIAARLFGDKAQIQNKSSMLPAGNNHS
jgi:hypothetical protein